MVWLLHHCIISADIWPSYLVLRPCYCFACLYELWNDRSSRKILLCAEQLQRFGGVVWADSSKGICTFPELNFPFISWQPIHFSWILKLWQNKLCPIPYNCAEYRTSPTKCLFLCLKMDLYSSEQRFFAFCSDLSMLPCCSDHFVIHQRVHSDRAWKGWGCFHVHWCLSVATNHLLWWMHSWWHSPCCSCYSAALSGQYICSV